MHNKAKSQVNSLSIALILTQLGAKEAVLNGLNYSELRLIINESYFEITS